MKSRQEYFRKWYQAHKEQERERQKEYRISHPEYQPKYQRQYIKRRRRTDVNFYLKDRLRSRLYYALKRSQKTGSAVRDLGCTISELKEHLESKFQPGMTWGNRGKEWHIDHVIPLAQFNLQDRQQFLIACHYTNLQPLWAKDNIVKGKSVLGM